MIGQTADERRTSRRVNFGGIVLVRNARQQIPCNALNLSETGILVRPAERANPGHQFRVTFALPIGGGGWVDVEGHLVHRTWIARRIAWGIQFASVPAVVRGKLREVVGTSEAPRDPAPPPVRAERSAPTLTPLPASVEPPPIDQQPTRRVAVAELGRLPGAEDTRQVPRTVIDRLVQGMEDDGS